MPSKKKHNKDYVLTLWCLLVWDQSFPLRLLKPFSLFLTSSWHLRNLEEWLQRWHRGTALKS